MRILLESFSIKDMNLKNRFVRSATYEGIADNGHVTDSQIELYSELADGGVGLIITGITNVYPSGQVSPFQNSIVGDEFVDGYKKLTKAVHDRGAKIAMQLFMLEENP